MNIAKVIVDVPASNVNQTFDYKVPDKFQSMIKKGMRVVIPFGPRKITGFVIGFTNESEFKKLREIIDILDIIPALTNELLELGRWLSDQTMSLYISTYQAMLPQVLKSKYERTLIKQSDTLPKELSVLFKNSDEISYEIILEKNINLKIIQQAIETGMIKEHYKVKSQITKKYQTIITPNVQLKELVEYEKQLAKNAHRQKQILNYFIEHNQPIEQNKLYKELGISRTNLKPLLEKELITLTQKEIYRNPYDRDFKKTYKKSLTEEQNNAIKPIHYAIEHNINETFLLYGVTGSGKTEIYLQAIDNVINKGQEAIVLVPEIALTPQMVEQFKGRFGERVAVMHSALSIGEKYDEWLKIRRGEVQVVVGARSAIFAPFKNLGIIIIDEEHEGTYKQEDTPRYHARDVAIERARINNCPVVLGSATPTLESFARAEKSVYTLLTLSKRTNNKPMPNVDVVDMRAELHSGNRTMFSSTLIDKMKLAISKNEQVVLLLNRRGYSNFALCRDCGHVEQCPNCDISLTYHKGHNSLKCHYCSYEMTMPNKCPACTSDLISFFGTGTERVEEALKKLLPTLKIIRMDVDTTRRKGAHERLLNKFSAGEADVLLGTQMIAKGLDFENVTLVGVLAADSMLHLPDFRAAEKTFQLLTQVSGRAGRHSLDGEVIIQSYTPEHYSINLASNYNFPAFYKKEMQMRRAFQYPPYVYLALITITDVNLNKVIEISKRFTEKLIMILSNKSIVLGPTPSPIARIKKRYRYQIIIKYRFEDNLQRKINAVKNEFNNELKKDLQILIDINPNQLM
ncbi:MAG TPA: primosomal protein N' [Pseudogracilibacillus sp.]|nr:primosomal protein N' [Pseudogracilibacillus sp.]